MIKPKRAVLILSIAAALAAGIFYFGGNSSINDEADTRLEEYVSLHISELSPVKEQLGGKFYVTKIEAEDGRGVVEYEDGHNAYTADFAYTFDESGRPSITSVRIRD